VERPGGCSEERILETFGVSAQAEAVWHVLLTGPDTPIRDLTKLTLLPQESVDAALEELLDAELVREGAAAPGVIAIDPVLAVETLITRGERQLAAQAAKYAELRAILPSVASSYKRGRVAAGEVDGIELVEPLDDVRRLIYKAGERCSKEARGLDRDTTVEGLREARPSAVAALERGVEMREIVGPHVISDPEVYAEYEILARHGQLARVVPSPATRMLVFDHDIAILPADTMHIMRGALFIRVRSIVDALIDLYDQAWKGGTPVFNVAQEWHGPTGRAAQILELLAAGFKDETIARTLGIASRTVRRDILEIKAHLGVRSRTEIVAAAMRRGWL